MTTRTVPDLKELFKQASEIAQQVPPNMQEAAFNRALDLLTGSSRQRLEEPAVQAPAGTNRRPALGTKRRVASVAGSAGGGTDRMESLLRNIDSTQHPAVVSAPKVLDQALMVLQIALDEQSVDGLSPGDIARVLREKFRVAAAETAVRMALSRAPDLVDRVKDGAGYSYRIMAPGSSYLAGKSSGDNSARPRGVARKAKKKGATTKPPSAPANGGEKRDVAAAKKKPATAPTGGRGGSNGLGPKAAVLALVGDGYFSSPRTASEVQGHLRTKRGYGIGIDQLRLAMLRLVRDQQLEREANANGEYEYQRK
jgi:hypothetical protein